MLGCGWPEVQVSAWCVWSPGAGGWALAGLWEALLGLADAGPASRVLWSAPGVVMVVASGTVSLLPRCDVGVVAGDWDPVGGVTVLLLPGLVGGVDPWAGELEEGGGCLVAHCGGGITQSLELWGDSVLVAAVLTVVLDL